ncbi:MAG: hypothetical protein D6780_02405, partial [Candidatus Dadabacteria bacterium]
MANDKRGVCDRVVVSDILLRLRGQECWYSGLQGTGIRVVRSQGAGWDRGNCKCQAKTHHCLPILKTGEASNCWNG